jgi:hypothetical protein
VEVGVQRIVRAGHQVWHACGVQVGAEHLCPAFIPCPCPNPHRHLGRLPDQEPGQFRCHVRRPAARTVHGLSGSVLGDEASGGH